MNITEAKVLPFPANELPERAPKRRKQNRRTGRVYTRETSPYWWISLSVNGSKICRRTDLLNTAPRKQAEQKLDDLKAELRVNPIPTGSALTVSDLALLYLDDYKVKRRRSIGHAKSRWEGHLKPFFGLYQAQRVSPDLIDRYRLHRTNEGASVATVNRELAALRRMFTIGKQKRKLFSVPFVEIIPEHNTRLGFLQDSNYAALAESCSKHGGLWLRALLECGYTFGWRRQELVTLRVSQVDIFRKTIRLEPGTTKNGEGREVSMTDAVCELLRPLVVGKAPTDQLFTRGSRPVKSIRKVWQNACCAVGLGRFACSGCSGEFTSGKRCPECKKRLVYSGLLFHDLRRTAARNLRRAGVDTSVIKACGGWKTDKVFSRYSIVAPADMQTAMRKLEADRAGNKISETVSETMTTITQPVVLQ
jgi:integrase